MGMGMTEKQGGSDVRANTTRAEPTAKTPGAPLITGHKWFLSAPMCDAFLVLAQSPRGLSCFFLPRWTARRAVNALRIQRLKDKMGNQPTPAPRSSSMGLAPGWSARRAAAWPDPGDGRLTRLDCALGTAGLMRRRCRWPCTMPRSARLRQALKDSR
jgi:putative acyl-CoA dehydrogenase